MKKIDDNVSSSFQVWWVTNVRLYFSTVIPINILKSSLYRCTVPTQNCVNITRDQANSDCLKSKSSCLASMSFFFQFIPLYTCICCGFFCNWGGDFPPRAIRQLIHITNESICVSKNNVQHRERETYKIFTWQPKSEKQLWEERCTIIHRLQELHELNARVSALCLVGSKMIQKKVLSLEEKVYLYLI